MVKKGGTKRKIPMEKIIKKESLATCHTKRLHGLFSKASQLCLLSGSQMAILATPPSSNSNVSFHSFGHSSVDGIVSSFLAGQRPVPVPEGNNRETREDVGICLTRKDLGLGLWWEDQTLAKSENLEELTDALGSMSKLLSNLKELHQSEYLKKSDQVFVNHEELKINDDTQKPLDQTLNLQSNSVNCCTLSDDSDKNTEEHDEILAICENFCVTENNTLTGNLDGYQEMDISELIDYESFLDCGVSESAETCASLNSITQNLFSDESVEGAFTEDDLRFYDFYNSIASL